MTPFATLARATDRLRRDTSGVALIEFAFSLPILLTLGLFGLETANLALINLRVSQIALNLADNASRVGLLNDIQIEQLREVDMNDVLQAVRNQGQSIGLTQYGRVTVSSLENADGTQRIHWQRCIGLIGSPGYTSNYGITSTNGQSSGANYDPTAGVNTASSGDNSASHPGSVATGAPGQVGIVGMGDNAADAVQAPLKGGVIFVEINYRYQPLLGNAAIIAPLLGTTDKRIHYTASFVIRDNRDLSQLYNPSPQATPSTCDKFTT